MRVGPGARIGPYEVREMIGAGGMGEVWLGHDSRLSRNAALKVLPHNIFGDHERLARFRREAQLLAQLNHPNIATIYGLHEEPGQPVCLAMEYVPGDTLAEKIRDSGLGIRGSGTHLSRASHGAPTASGERGLPIEDALDITTQICEALEHGTSTASSIAI